MEQFIGCDAHKKFSVFVTVNEKGQAGEVLRSKSRAPTISGVFAGASRPGLEVPPQISGRSPRSGIFSRPHLPQRNAQTNRLLVSLDRFALHRPWSEFKHLQAHSVRIIDARVRRSAPTEVGSGTVMPRFRNSAMVSLMFWRAREISF